MSYYILTENRSVKEATFDEWKAWRQKMEEKHGASHDYRRVGRTEVSYDGKNYTVSTVFLSHGLSKEESFETMVFEGSTGAQDHYCERYPTWKKASIGHAKIVSLLQMGKLEMR